MDLPRSTPIFSVDLIMKLIGRIRRRPREYKEITYASQEREPSLFPMEGTPSFSLLDIKQRINVLSAVVRWVSVDFEQEICDLTTQDPDLYVNLHSCFS